MPSKQFMREERKLERRNWTKEGDELRQALPKDKKGWPLLSEELIVELKSLVAEGNTPQNAAKVCGLPLKKLNLWLNKGAEDVEAEVESLEAKLAISLYVAQGDQERKLSRLVFHRAEENDPRLGLEILSRRFANDWAPATPEKADLASHYGQMKLEDAMAEIKRLTENKPEEKK